MSTPHVHVPPNEPARLAALREYRILDTPPEAAFDDLARLAAQVCRAPVSLISFVDEARVWHKARVGFEAPEMPRLEAICSDAVLSPHPLLPGDLAVDPRYATRPGVGGESGWRFYAGAPLIAPGGFAVGVLCVLDRSPRQLDAAQVEALETLARQVITHLELRRNLRRLERSIADHEQSETALRLAETRYRSIFENVAEGIFQTTAEGMYLAANPMLARIYGYDSPEELKAAVHDIKGQLYVQPTRRDEFIQAMRERGEVHHFESQARRKDGSEIWISENARSVTDAAGRLLYYEGTVEDITERKQAEQALRNSELLYHSLVEYLPQNIFRKDRSGRFTFVNQLFCQTLKRRPEEILCHTDYEFFPPELAAKYQEDDRRVMETLQPFEQTEEHQRPDGSMLYVHVIKTPLRDASGAVIGVQGIFWDETERHRIEAALAYERDLLRALLDSVPDAIYFKDRESRFIRASRALAEKFGVGDPEKLRAKTDFHFFTADHAKPAYDDEQRIILTGQPIVGVTEKETWPDGRVTWALTSKLPLRNQQGRIIGTFGVSKDITDLIRVEQELEQARDAALDAAKLKAEILANMSHEIRTPMNAIIGTADLLLRSALTPEQREFAEQIHHGGETLLNVINGILDLSRLESGRMTLESIEFDLRDTVESAVELLAESAHSKGLDLTCWIQPEVPERLRGDPVRLRQVLTNLVGNAIKFTNRGEVSVRVGLARESADGLELRFEVEDTGVGVAPDAMARIFEPFRQADGSTTRRFGGSGLGLSISRQIVGLMRGQMEVRSEPGAGSLFTFTAHFNRPAFASPEAPEALNQLKGVRALVVDDHAPSRRVLLQTLRWWGIIAEEANDGAEALALLLREAASGIPFEFVLLDASLGEISGLELAVAIKDDPRVPPPRVVLLSSLGGWLDPEAMRAHGVSACLIKPPRRSRLLASLLSLKQAGVPASAPASPVAATVPGLTGPPLRVLVAEDNEFNRKLAVHQLTRLGHSVATAANGLEVLAALRDGPADVLLLDCQMPEMDGYQAARAIREREATAPPAADSPRRPLYIVALTANALQGDRERCLAAGMDDYITKPVRLADLEAALARSRGGQAGATPVAAAAPEADAVLDAGALRALGDDPTVVHELGDLFLHTAGELVPRLRQAMAAGDAAALRAAAHSLKGSAVNFGARRLGRLAAELERKAKAGALSDAAGLLDQLEPALEEVRAALPRPADTGNSR